MVVVGDKEHSTGPPRVLPIFHDAPRGRQAMPEQVLYNVIADRRFFKFMGDFAICFRCRLTSFITFYSQGTSALPLNTIDLSTSRSPSTSLPRCAFNFRSGILFVPVTHAVTAGYVVHVPLRARQSGLSLSRNAKTDVVLMLLSTF